MVRVVGVRFKKAGKIYYFDPAEFPVAGGCKVIVETARGIEYGDVAVGPKYVDDVEVVQPLKRVIRIGSDKDATQVAENKRKEREAFAAAVRKISSHGLDMNLVDVEYTFDGSKIIFYFTAEGRVDFRELVKDLASVFRTRIEMRQIGVRDEAKLLGGIGPCGRILCCTSFLGEFAPVSIRMAKDQNLSLNPTKISGVCGRLMCCLRYEQDTYEAAKKDPTLAPGYVPPLLMEADGGPVPALEEEESKPSWQTGPLRGDAAEGEVGGRISRAVAMKNAAVRDAEIETPIRVGGSGDTAQPERQRGDRPERGERREGGRHQGGRPQGRPQQHQPRPQGQGQPQGARQQQNRPQPQAKGQPGGAQEQAPPRGERQGQKGRPQPGQPNQQNQGQQQGGKARLQVVPGGKGQSQQPRGERGGQPQKGQEQGRPQQQGRSPEQGQGHPRGERPPHKQRDRGHRPDRGRGPRPEGQGGQAPEGGNGNPGPNSQTPQN